MVWFDCAKGKSSGKIENQLDIQSKLSKSTVTSADVEAPLVILSLICTASSRKGEFVSWNKYAAYDSVSTTLFRKCFTGLVSIALCGSFFTMYFVSLSQHSLYWWLCNTVSLEQVICVYLVLMSLQSVEYEVESKCCYIYYYSFPINLDILEDCDIFSPSKLSDLNILTCNFWTSPDNSVEFVYCLSKYLLNGYCGRHIFLFILNVLYNKTIFFIITPRVDLCLYAKLVLSGIWGFD